MTGEALRPTDEELVDAALGGDMQSFEELVRRYQVRLVNYLFRLLHNAEEAEDLAQEVFLKVYQALDRFDPAYRFSTWIFRVAQNAGIDRIRKRRIRWASFQHRVGPDGETEEWEPVSERRGPYGDLRNRERGEAIQAAIDGLPWEYRELILLRHFADLSYEEISRLKKLPLGTVKNKLFRGRQMLKESLGDFLTD